VRAPGIHNSCLSNWPARRDYGFRVRSLTLAPRNDALLQPLRVRRASGFRPQRGEGYYAAFIRDADGNRVEAVTFVK